MTDGTMHAIILGSAVGFAVLVKQVIGSLWSRYRARRSGSEPWHDLPNP